ncbi:MAG: LOG family protein [Candidatus Eisenbacteria bacterium]
MPIPVHRQPVVAVFGSSTVREADAAWRDAHTLGGALAKRGLATMTGGYGGAMAAASRGAHDAGGHVIGVTVDLFERRGPVNPWVRERVHTPDLFERLRYLADAADGFVAVAGSIGTLSELFLVWTLVSVEGRAPAPIVLMGAQWHAWLELHKAPEFVPARLHGFVQVAETPELAAEAVAAGIERARGARVASAMQETHA